MDDFDMRMRERAKTEDCPVPEGFDERVEEMAAELPGQHRRTLRPLRTALLAAAVCGLLCISALALSPTLREALAGALGGFVPYARPVEGVSCVENGIEIKVITAMADSAMVKVYAEARDLTGNRLKDLTDVFGGVERQRPEGARHGTTAVSGTYVGFDEESEAALLEFSVWGSPAIQQEELRLKVLYLCLNGADGESVIGVPSDGEKWDMGLNVERLEERTFELTGTLQDAFGESQLRQMYISPLGVTLRVDGDGTPPKDQLRVYLQDGTVLHLPFGGMGDVFGETEDSQICCWEFENPADLDQITGVSIGKRYIPVNGNTAGEAYWLDEVP